MMHTLHYMPCCAVPIELLLELRELSKLQDTPGWS